MYNHKTVCHVSNIPRLEQSAVCPVLSFKPALSLPSSRSSMVVSVFWSAFINGWRALIGVVDIAHRVNRKISNLGMHD